MLTNAERENVAVGAGHAAADQLLAETSTHAILEGANAPAPNVAGIAVEVLAGSDADRWMQSRGWRADNFRKAFVRAWLQTYRSRARAIQEADPAWQAAERARRFGYVLTGMLDGAKSTLDKFQQRFAENPAYAFEWGADAVVAAARQDVATRLGGIAAETSVDQALTLATREALRGARYPSHSTSALSNLVMEAKTQAMAEIVTDMEGY